MTFSFDASIDNRIVQMRKDGSYILTIHSWVSQWDNFKQLDEVIVLSHICRVLDNSNLAVSRNEVRKCFNKFYSPEFHGDKMSYLNWIYQTFKIKDQTRVNTSQVRKKTLLPQTAEGISGCIPCVLDEVDQNHSKTLTFSVGGLK